MRFRPSLAATLALLVAGGCASDPGPVAPAGEEFAPVVWRVTPEPELLDHEIQTLDSCGRGNSGYPLQLGNEWKYEARVTTELLSGESGPVPEQLIRTTKSAIVGGETLLGRCYVVEESEITEDIDPAVTHHRRVFYREDRSGLYEADVVVGGPAGQPWPVERLVVDYTRSTLEERTNGESWVRAYDALQARVELARSHRARPRTDDTSGALEGELTRLDYPLHRGKSWMIIDGEFDLRATVVRRVVLRLPTGRTPAWCLRYESSFFEPDDEVLFYFGRDGYLGSQLSVLTSVVDDGTGEVIGRLRFNDEEFLEEIEIDRRAELPCSGSRAGGSRPDMESR